MTTLYERGVAACTELVLLNGSNWMTPAEQAGAHDEMARLSAADIAGLVATARHYAMHGMPEYRPILARHGFA